MGTDLTVTPIRHHELNYWLAYNRISFDRDYVLQDKIRELAVKPLPFGKKYVRYDDEVEPEIEDAYGDPLTYLLPRDFEALRAVGWNKAVLLLLQNLPPKTPIVLWWH